MHLSLIGMSNSGKSYWSKKLQSLGFLRFSSDDYIEYKLGNILKQLGYQGIADMSKWLGQPYEKRHVINSRIYLDLEKESIDYFISQIQADKLSERNIVMDTTGSVIYAGEILKELKKFTKIIYLDTPNVVQKQMLDSYITNPKPVLWQGSFYKLDNESNMNALARCYPEFLKYRTSQYQALADITINYFQLRTKNFSINKFLELIS